MAVLLLLDDEMETEIAPIWSESSDIKIMHPLETGTYLMTKFLPLWDFRVLSTIPWSDIIYGSYRPLKANVRPELG